MYCEKSKNKNKGKTPKNHFWPNQAKNCQTKQKSFSLWVFLTGEKTTALPSNNLSVFWPNQPNEKRKRNRIREKRTQKNGEEQRIQKNGEELRGMKMGNGELRGNGKQRGVRSKIQNETYVGKYKSLREHN